VVGGHVEDGGDARAQRVQPLDLERGELEDHHVGGRAGEHVLGEGRPQVPAGEGAPVAGEEGAAEGGGGALPVRPGDGHHGRPRRQEAGGELDLAPHRHAAGAGAGERGDRGRHAGRDHHQVRPLEVGGIVAAQGAARVDAGQGGERRGELGLRAPVGHGEARALAGEQARRGHAAPGEADHGDLPVLEAGRHEGGRPSAA
jgi:hypothetical protein